MRNNKGISPLIATFLLIAITIIMFILAGYLIKSSKKDTEGLLKETVEWNCCTHLPNNVELEFIDKDKPSKSYDIPKDFYDAQLRYDEYKNNGDLCYENITLTIFGVGEVKNYDLECRERIKKVIEISEDEISKCLYSDTEIKARSEEYLSYCVKNYISMEEY